MQQEYINSEAQYKTFIEAGLIHIFSFLLSSLILIAFFNCVNRFSILDGTLINHDLFVKQPQKEL